MALQVHHDVHSGTSEVITAPAPFFITGQHNTEGASCFLQYILYATICVDSLSPFPKSSAPSDTDIYRLSVFLGSCLNPAPSYELFCHRESRVISCGFSSHILRILLSDLYISVLSLATSPFIIRQSHLACQKFNPTRSLKRED